MRGAGNASTVQGEDMGRQGRAGSPPSRLGGLPRILFQGQWGAMEGSTRVQKGLPFKGCEQAAGGGGGGRDMLGVGRGMRAVRAETRMGEAHSTALEEYMPTQCHLLRQTLRNASPMDPMCVS